MSRVGAKNSNWRGGRRRGGEGMRYWMVYRPDHPNAMRSGVVLEHRLVMEEKLGRLLERNEIVHHINGDTLDNRPENLQVMTQAEHARLHYDEHLRPNGYIRPPAERVKRSCKGCGIGFEAVGAREKGKRFCSKECYWTSGYVGKAVPV